MAKQEIDAARGERFRALCRGLFPGQSRAFIAEVLGGVSGGTIRNWELGHAISSDALSRLEELGVSLDFLLRGEDTPMRERIREARSSAPEPAVDKTGPKYLARVIGANLKHLRKIRFPGWGGQKKFAEFLDLTANDLCVYEYGRSVPNEQRLGEIAERLGLTPDELKRPLPDVVVTPAPRVEGVAAGPLAEAEKAWSDRQEELKRDMARMEGRLEALQEQIQRQEDEIRRLREANVTLRNLLYVEDTPEARKRRERMLDKLAPSITELVRRQETF